MAQGFVREDAISNSSHAICEGRLTLTSGTPVTITDVTGAGTLYFSPYKGNKIGVYNGTNWQVREFSEISLALTLTSGKNYDVFIYDNAGTLTLELSAAWTTDAARADALALQNGIYVKSGTATRRYLGTIRASGTNTTEDSMAKRFVWNYYQKIQRNLVIIESTDSWTYTSVTWRQANNSANNQLALVVGLAEEVINLSVVAAGKNSVYGTNFYCSIGEDSSTTPMSNVLQKWGKSFVADLSMMYRAEKQTIVPAGYHYYTWLESSDAAGTTTFWGDAGVPLTIQCGMYGNILM